MAEKAKSKRKGDKYFEKMINEDTRTKRKTAPLETWVDRRYFTPEEKQQILKSTGGVCACCGKKLTTKTMTIEHIIPIYRQGTNDFENLTALCSKCNKRKNKTMYLPSTFYMALAGTGRIREMEQMVRTWLKENPAWDNDVEQYPMLMPIHYILMHMPNSRPVFSKQLLYKWQFILAKDRPEAEAITEIDMRVINKVLHRDSDNPNYKHYGIPIQYYVLKKESKDKYLGVCAVRYDEQNKDLVVWLIWKDPGVSKFGSQQIITTCLTCLYDAILTIAEKPLHDVLLLSNYDNCYPYFLTAKFRDYGANYQLHTLQDTISNTDIHAVSYTRYPNAKPKKLHHYFEIPIWMKERKEIE